MPNALDRSSARRAMRPPRALALVRDPAPEEIDAAIDWSAWHLDWDDDVGQSPEHDDVAFSVRSALRLRMDELGRSAVRVGNDAFFAWVESDPLVRVSPDVYTLRGSLPEGAPRMFETWRDGHLPPVFALEIVSEDWRKDYEEAPAKYALLGAEELVVFDPAAARGEARGTRVALQVYRRTADGAFVRVYAGTGPVRAESIESWLVAGGSGAASELLRLARDPAGRDVVPTQDEARRREAERADDEKLRADDEKRRADDEKLRADDEKRRADDEKRRADDEKRRADALAAELEALRRRG